MDEARTVELLLREHEELDQLLFEAKARHLVREYLESGWITKEHADDILILLLGEPCI